MATTALSAYRAGQRSAKVKTRRRRREFTLPLAVVAGFAPTALYAWDRFKVGDYDNGFRRILGRMTGWDSWQNTWRYTDLIAGMGPVFGGLIIHKLANKYGINRALKNAGIPFVRI